LAQGSAIQRGALNKSEFFKLLGEIPRVAFFAYFLVLQPKSESPTGERQKQRRRNEQAE
jgi:hypothetical protein